MSIHPYAKPVWDTSDFKVNHNSKGFREQFELYAGPCIIQIQYLQHKESSWMRWRRRWGQNLSYTQLLFARNYELCSANQEESRTDKEWESSDRKGGAAKVTHHPKQQDMKLVLDYLHCLTKQEAQWWILQLANPHLRWGFKGLSYAELQ